MDVINNNMNYKDQNNISQLYTEGVQSVGFKPVNSAYIYFIDDDELYQTDPYKLLAAGVEGESVSSTAVLFNKLQKQGVRWKEARIASSDDVIELAPDTYKSISNNQAWVQVDNSFPRDHSFWVELGYK